MKARLLSRNYRNRRHYLLPRLIWQDAGDRNSHLGTHRFRFLYTSVEALPRT